MSEPLSGRQAALRAADEMHDTACKAANAAWADACRVYRAAATAHSDAITAAYDAWEAARAEIDREYPQEGR